MLNIISFTVSEISDALVDLKSNETGGIDNIAPNVSETMHAYALNCILIIS